MPRSLAELAGLVVGYLAESRSMTTSNANSGKPPLPVYVLQLEEATAE